MKICGRLSDTSLTYKSDCPRCWVQWRVLKDSKPEMFYTGQTALPRFRYMGATCEPEVVPESTPGICSCVWCRAARGMATQDELWADREGFLDLPKWNKPQGGLDSEREIRRKRRQWRRGFEAYLRRHWIDLSADPYRQPEHWVPWRRFTAWCKECPQSPLTKDQAGVSLEVKQQKGESPGFSPCFRINGKNYWGFPTGHGDRRLTSTPKIHIEHRPACNLIEVWASGIAPGATYTCRKHTLSAEFREDKTRGEGRWPKGMPKHLSVFNAGQLKGDVKKDLRFRPPSRSVTLTEITPAGKWVRWYCQPLPGMSKTRRPLIIASRLDGEPFCERDVELPVTSYRVPKDEIEAARAWIHSKAGNLAIQAFTVPVSKHPAEDPIPHSRNEAIAIIRASRGVATWTDREVERSAAQAQKLFACVHRLVFNWSAACKLRPAGEIVRMRVDKKIREIAESILGPIYRAQTRLRNRMTKELWATQILVPPRADWQQAGPNERWNFERMGRDEEQEAAAQAADERQRSFCELLDFLGCLTDEEYTSIVLVMRDGLEFEPPVDVKLIYAKVKERWVELCGNPDSIPPEISEDLEEFLGDVLPIVGVQETQAEFDSDDPEKTITVTTRQLQTGHTIYEAQINKAYIEKSPYHRRRIEWIGKMQCLAADQREMTAEEWTSISYIIRIARALWYGLEIEPPPVDGLNYGKLGRGFCRYPIPEQREPWRVSKGISPYLPWRDSEGVFHDSPGGIQEEAKAGRDLEKEEEMSITDWLQEVVSMGEHEYEPLEGPGVPDPTSEPEAEDEADDESAQGDKGDN